MLTAKSGIDDKVYGLDCGADDYLTKPFLPRELLARIRALVRRNGAYDGEALRFGDITLDAAGYEVCGYEVCCEKSKEQVRLGEKEYRLLEYLMLNRGVVLSKEQRIP